LSTDERAGSAGTVPPIATRAAAVFAESAPEKPYWRTFREPTRTGVKDRFDRIEEASSNNLS
jgi:hypothetical protein